MNTTSLRKRVRVLLVALFVPACGGASSVRCDPSLSFSGGPPSRSVLDAAVERSSICREEPGVVSCAFELALGQSHACTKLGTLEIVCQGDNRAFQSAPFADAPPRVGPTFVDQRGTNALALGTGFSCATYEGALVCWGDPDVVGDAPDHGPHVIANAGSPLSSIAAGAFHICWTYREGRDLFDRSGPLHLACTGAWDGFDPRSGRPAAPRDGGEIVSMFTPIWEDYPLELQLAAGGTQTCAFSYEAGEIVCWGGVAPEGSALAGDWSVPPQKIELIGVLDVAVGPRHSCAIGDGGCACWGQNDRGQLGTGDREPRDAPAETISGHPLSVCAGGEIVRDDEGRITYGGSHSCIVVGGERGLDERVRLLCWGANDRGQLGDGTTEDRLEPVEIPVEAPISVSCGGANTCVVTGTQERLLCWGDNRFGQIAPGDPRETITTPTPLVLP
jgi:hypothetical protein